MSAAADALTEFHEFYGRDNPTLGLELRRTLIEEEFDELNFELEQPEPDLQKVYKELADLIYVAYGLDLHLGGQLDRVVAEVHRSNMTKLWECEVCYGEGSIMDQTPAPICPKCEGSGRVVKRREDGKILKPPTYEKADLSFLKETP